MILITLLTNENILITIFTAIIIIAAIFFFFSKNEKWVLNAPSVLTTLGISCTFAGMTVALAGFNSFNSTGGIESLFGGMKLAFIPSTIAIILALVFKLLAISKQHYAAHDFYSQLEINNQYLHSLLNYHIPGFNLPPENKESQMVRKQKLPFAKYKKIDFDYSIFDNPNVFVIMDKSKHYCLILSSDSDLIHARLLHRLYSGEARQVIKQLGRFSALVYIENKILARFLFKNITVDNVLPISLPRMKALSSLAPNEVNLYCNHLIREIKDYRIS